MFKAAEVDRTLSRQDFKKLEPEVHQQLLSLQQRLRKSAKALIIIVAGVEGAGKGEVVDKLNRWFDCRDVQTHAFWEETDEERQRPKFWRFWRTLPMRGSVSVMFGSWYSTPIVESVYSRLDQAGLDRELNRIARLEQTLSDGGNIIVKLWFHLPKSVQQRRLRNDAKVSKFKKSPLLEEFSKSYDKFAKVFKRALRLTDSGHAPWHIIEASDVHYRDISTANVIIASLQQGLPKAA